MLLRLVLLDNIRQASWATLYILCCDYARNASMYHHAQQNLLALRLFRVLLANRVFTNYKLRLRASLSAIYVERNHDCTYFSPRYFQLNMAQD